MSDDTPDDRALTIAPRQLAERTALVNRGIVLADALVRQRADAKRHLDQAWHDWVSSHPTEVSNVPEQALQNAIFAFDNAVTSAALWFGVEPRGAMTDFITEVTNGAGWRAWQERRSKEQEPLRGEFEPWICGGMEELAAVIQKVKNGAQLADTGWTPDELTMEIMLFLEEVSGLMDASPPWEAARTET